LEIIYPVRPIIVLIFFSSYNMDEFRIEQMLDDASDKEIWGYIASNENEVADQSQV